MRLLRILPLLLTVLIIWLLDRPLGKVPALGRLLDPINGWAAHAEPAERDFSRSFALPGLQQPVTIWFEDRLVPHIRAANDHDLYYAQGYVHAYFRLWQMDLQTRAAAGRVSEVIGAQAVSFDRMQRRKGMVFGAEHSLREMESEPRSKQMLDAYRDGINAFIAQCSFRDLPLEYKLMGFEPEPWTNIKSALLLKYMADDLTGYTEDIALSYLRDRLPEGQFDFLFPERISGSKPVIPAGTAHPARSLPQPQAPDSGAFVHFPDVQESTAGSRDINAAFQMDREAQSGIGSNNWALGGALTASGAPILCNDPHLGLNLPSLWFEVQLQAPGINTYGVSLPGAPGVVIGFNDSISWGFTNNYRDVKDFYELQTDGRSTYMFEGKQLPLSYRVETIQVKGRPAVTDTVYYSLHGPVIYDRNMPDPASSGKTLALTWMAHRPSNEMLSLYLLNRAGNYDQFVAAIQHFKCPGQNMIYADRQNNIALWGQGQFINKWKGQGRFVMRGTDSSTLWGQEIPIAENPHVLNPPEGYLSSANQSVTDERYPYWYNGYFYEFRSWRIHELLEGLKVKKATAADMMQMQQDVVSVLARETGQGLQAMMPAAEGRSWNFALDAESRKATEAQLFWAMLYDNIWKDEFAKVPGRLWPSPERSMQLVLSDTASPYYDDQATAGREMLRHMVQRSLAQTHDSLERLKENGLAWYQVKNTTVNHLSKIPSFGYHNLKVGGWGNTINAVKQTHGPSWRMVVEMGRDSIRAFGVYPGGQSGNPGSSRYASMLPDWTEGRYYRLHFYSPGQIPRGLPFTWQIQKS